MVQDLDLEERPRFMVQEALRGVVERRYKTLSITSDPAHAEKVEQFVERYLTDTPHTRCVIVDERTHINTLWVQAISGVVFLFRQPVEPPDLVMIERLVEGGATVVKVACDKSQCLAGSELLELFDEGAIAEPGNLTARAFGNFERVRIFKGALLQRLASLGVDLEEFNREISTTDPVFQLMLDLCQPDKPQPGGSSGTWNGVDRSGDPIIFLRNTYGDAIDSGRLSRAELRERAPRFMKALEAWCRSDDRPRVADLFVPGGNLKNYRAR